MMDYPIPIRCMICRIEYKRWVEFDSEQQLIKHLETKHPKPLVEFYWHIFDNNRKMFSR